MPILDAQDLDRESQKKTTAGGTPAVTFFFLVPSMVEVKGFKARVTPLSPLGSDLGRVLPRCSGLYHTS